MSKRCNATRGRALLKAIPAILLGMGFSVGSALAADDGARGSSVDSTQAADDEAAGAIGGDDNYFKIGGYVRSWLSYNLKDQPDTPNYNDKWKASMARMSVSLTGDAKTGPVVWHGVLRSDREALTSYEKHLQDMVRTNTPGGPGSHVLDQYNRTDLREFYGEFDLGDRVHMKVGKQQVVWGETDFFHPTDLLQGYDFRWRSFVEGESDELRKPLIMINTKIAVPEVNGALQVIVRPGLDRNEDIGNSYMLAGGRWMVQPNKGVDLLTLTNFDFDHPSGKSSDVTGGLRWTGLAGPTNYSLSWLRTFQPNMVLNPSANPYRKAPTGILGDWFYPVIDVFAASLSGEVGAIDAVVNGELAYHKGALYNSGLASNGFAGPVLKKDVIQSTLRVDKQLRLQNILGTNAPTLFSAQLFDTWIQNFKGSDGIVENVGFTHGIRVHTTIATIFAQFPYMNSKLVPGIAVGRYLQARDTFVIPSISYNMGNHWRFLAEANLFFAKHQDTPTHVDPQTGGLGVLGQTSQLMLRATYQF